VRRRHGQRFQTTQRFQFEAERTNAIQHIPSNLFQFFTRFAYASRATFIHNAILKVGWNGHRGKFREAGPNIPPKRVFTQVVSIQLFMDG
jgi:hypothetical protein